MPVAGSRAHCPAQGNQLGEIIVPLIRRPVLQFVLIAKLDWRAIRKCQVLVRRGNGRCGRFGKRDKSLQHIVQFVGVANVRPGFFADCCNRGWIQAPDFREHRLGQGAAHLHGTGAALLKRSIIEVGVRIGIQNFV